MCTDRAVGHTSKSQMQHNTRKIQKIQNLAMQNFTQTMKDDKNRI